MSDLIEVLVTYCMGQEAPNYSPNGTVSPVWLILVWVNPVQ